MKSVKLIYNLDEDTGSVMVNKKIIYFVQGGFDLEPIEALLAALGIKYETVEE